MLFLMQRCGSVKKVTLFYLGRSVGGQGVCLAWDAINRVLTTRDLIQGFNLNALSSGCGKNWLFMRICARFALLMLCSMLQLSRLIFYGELTCWLCVS